MSVHNILPVYIYSSYHCPSLTLHWSTSTPPSIARPYPFTGLPLLIISMPVRTPSPLSLYSSIYSYSSFHTPSLVSHSYSFCWPSISTGLPLLLPSLHVFTPSPVSLYYSFLCSSIPLHPCRTTPLSRACHYPFTCLPLLLVTRPVFTTSTFFLY